MSFIQWLYLVGQVQDAGGDKSQLTCPNCASIGTVDIQYVGDQETRIGYAAIWCIKCQKGVQTSRAKAPNAFDLLPFESSAEEIQARIPNFERVEPR